MTRKDAEFVAQRLANNLNVNVCVYEEFRVDTEELIKKIKHPIVKTFKPKGKVLK